MEVIDFAQTTPEKFWTVFGTQSRKPRALDLLNITIRKLTEIMADRAMSAADDLAESNDDGTISLTEDSAVDIAEKLMDMEDQGQLRKIASYINDHLKHPDRTPQEKAVALGRIGFGGLNGPLSKTAALARLREPPLMRDHSWRVEGSTADGRRWINGVRLGSREEAEAYVEFHVRFDLEKQGYASAEIIRCNDPPANSINRARKGGRANLIFTHGTCGALEWHPQGDVGEPQSEDDV
jgi:hypothetical protein